MTGRTPPPYDELQAGRAARAFIVQTFGGASWFRGASLRWNGSQVTVYVYGDDGGDYVPVPRGTSLPSSINGIPIYVAFPPDQAHFRRPPDCQCGTMECGELGTICAPCPSFMADYHHPLNQGICHQDVTNP
jgi:hypothetical protein